MFEHMTTAERIQAARVKIERVVDHLLYLLALHESNAIIVYSDTLSSQIRRSLAANAFKVFQGGLHQFEIVRLCALWEPAKDDKKNIPTEESIPTIVELIDLNDAIYALAQQTREQWPEPDDYEFALEEENKARDGLRAAIKGARNISTSSMLRSTMNIRHKHLAHSLAETRFEKAGPVAPMKYGYERKILFETLPIVEALYCWVSGKGFCFANSREIARKNADALWKRCTFATR
jgi:hypothetical protein